MTNDAPTSGFTEDRRLAGRIAVLMRLGTAVASALLVVGIVFGCAHRSLTATTLLTSGYGLLILLPVIRLAMMAGHFGRLADTRFIIVTVAVLVLVFAGGATGIAL